MSRSFKKNPFLSVVKIRTQKPWKQSYNRIFRRKSKQVLGACRNYEEYHSEELYKQRYADIWKSPSDGRYYYPIEAESPKRFESYREYKLWYIQTVLGK